MIKLLFFVLLIFFYILFSVSFYEKICYYLEPYKNYKDILCGYEIKHYIVIYDLCYEELPNFRCFIKKLPQNIILTIFNDSFKRIAQRTCDNCNYCNYAKQIKGSYPLPLYNLMKSLMKLRNVIKIKINISKSVNIIIGNGRSYKNRVTSFSDNWIPTDQDVFDVTNRYYITQFLFSNSVDNMVANHVFEHIYYKDIINSFLNLKYLLKDGGKLFFCLPDINAKDSLYWKNYTDAINVQPDYGHRVFYSYNSLKFIAEKCKMTFIPLSYHLDNGNRIDNQSNYIFFEDLDIKSYMIGRIKYHLGYSICSILIK